MPHCAQCLGFSTVPAAPATAQGKLRHIMTSSMNPVTAGPLVNKRAAGDVVSIVACFIVLLSPFDEAP
jgi:hypothetical protein